MTTDPTPRLPYAWLRVTDSGTRDRRCEVMIGGTPVAELPHIGYTLENQSGTVWTTGPDGTRTPAHSSPVLTVRLLAEPVQHIDSMRLGR